MTKRRLLPALLAFGIVFIATESARAQFWEVTSAPNTNWISVASSYNGEKVVAVAGGGGPKKGSGPIYTSANSGATWAVTSAPITNWTAVASSADADKLVAVAGGYPDSSGPIYTSTNSGATWSATSAPITNWTAVASSADGNKLVASAVGPQPSYEGPIYTSTNSGMTWSQTDAPISQWASVASSADGSKLAAADLKQIYVSTNSGSSWTVANLPLSSWGSIACSPDGSELIAGIVFNNAPISKSVDWGATWVATDSPSYHWNKLAISPDGHSMSGIAMSVLVYASTNSGMGWTKIIGPDTDWYSIVPLGDGGKWIAVAANGHIYKSQSGPTLSGSITDTNLVISWPVYATGYRLQQKTNVNDPSWTDVPELPVVVNEKKAVSISLPTSDHFYQLVADPSP